MELSAGYLRHHALDDILDGIRARADATGFDLLVLTGLSSEVTGEPTHYLDLCRAHQAEGIIFSSFVPEEPELVELATSEFPCVSIEAEIGGPRTAYTSSDSFGGAVAAVRHLAALGRKRIAYLGGWGHEPVSRDRQRGYESVLDELGLERREDYVLRGGWLHGQAHEEARRVLALADRPDAIFCASDRMAIGALLACEEAGLEVPRDVAVAGFDDEEFAALCTPSLTTIRQDRIGLGAASLEAVARLLDDPNAPPTATVFPVELVVRESSDPSGASQAGGAAGVPLKERLSVGDLFGALGTAEVFQPRELGDTTAGRSEIWRPEERRTIAVASDTTPDQSYRHAYFDDVFYGLRACAHAHATDLIILTGVWPDADVFPPFLDLCRRYNADGVIVSSLPPDDPEIVSLTESGFPCVAFDVELLGRRTAFVRFDNVGAAVEIVRHLAESGRRRIAFIGGRAGERASIDRQFGYRSELAKLDLPYKEEYMQAGEWLHDRAYQATRLMLDLAEPPDAIFAASDIMAVGAMAAIEDLRLRVPEDVAVVGFDDLEIARMVAPSLTSVSADQTQLVTALIDAMFDLLDRPEAPPRAKILPAELVARESSAGDSKHVGA